MGIFKKKDKSNITDQSAMARTVLNAIEEGVIIVDSLGTIKMINPAATAMVGHKSPELILGTKIGSLAEFENGEGMKIDPAQNKLFLAVGAKRAEKTREYILTNTQGGKVPVAITVTPMSEGRGDIIVTLRDIAKELEEEGAQAEFISTASHEMRTPVASIEGYLGLALNTQTATIDDRARQYLTAAHTASQHLGKLFRDLLDVTRLDDNQLKLRLAPVEMQGLVKEIAESQLQAMTAKKINFSFGTQVERSDRLIDQVVYCSVDIDFLREIINNLLENAIKYTPEGGSIWVNVRGDGDRALINVTDTGMGIAPDDLKHIFQKFYRVDNSQTRTIGGTGLGLYIVKQRVEAMGGNVWAESSFNEGSTFYVSLPRISDMDYHRQQIVIANEAQKERATRLAMAEKAEAMTVTTEKTEETEDTPAKTSELVEVEAETVASAIDASKTMEELAGSSTEKVEEKAKVL